MGFDKITIENMKLGSELINVLSETIKEVSVCMMSMHDRTGDFKLIGKKLFTELERLDRAYGEKKYED